MALNLKSIGQRFGPITKPYTWKDIVTYALGVGAGYDELDYCFENQLKAIPSFAIGILPEFVTYVGMNSGANPNASFHGGHEILFHNPIPTEGRLNTEGAITHMYDRGEGKGALVVGEAVTYHSNGEKLFTNIMSLFCLKDGGFGGDPPPVEAVKFPDRSPDFEENALPSPNQPLLYRLSGDIFPLHVDQDFARASGFERPIMHGLCTHGFACRAVIKHLFPGEPERMIRFGVRFTRPVYPGVPISTQIWKIEEGKALFRVTNVENGDVVIDKGLVEWVSRDEIKKRSGLGAINFEERVAVVTGAGSGLGHVYALELAQRGAKVVVNDFGAKRDGTGEGSKDAADRVVEEIKALGGVAVASYESVATPEGGQAIVDSAIEAFGRVDILVNNAGILRDRSLIKMEPENWDAVLDVHLKGAFNVTRPAFTKMRENGYGRIILTTSAAGLYGSFGQSNYAAAKMGLIGFMNTLKLEGEKYNIKVNCVAPVAGTRMTKDVMPPDLFEKVKPELVAPLVLYLCSEQCPVSGGIYNAGMGFYNRTALVTGPGSLVGDGTKVPTLEEIHRQWDAINNLSGALEFQNAQSAFAPIFESVTSKYPGGKGQGELTVKAVFDAMPEAFQADKAAGLEGVFQYGISGPEGGSWFLEIKGGTCNIHQGTHRCPAAVILMTDDDFKEMIRGKMSAMDAYMSGKMKVKGDPTKSQLIEKYFKL
jgi:NAD(P)-dependent dehydrogenase (short-subunit alcohol dehydrogenase family)/acyl dehydratase/putative sterol carrier protein